jgi:hypothetical protein
MQQLFISPTPLSPEINFSPEDNIFIIKGVSSPEDVRAMYYPIIDWVRQFVDDLIHFGSKAYSEESPLKFHTELVYFNSSSAKFLYDIFMELKRLLAVGIPVVVEWAYDEEDIDLKEAGQDIALLLDMDFIYVPVKRSA